MILLESCGEAFFGKPESVAAAVGFPVEAVGPVEADLGFFGRAVGPLCGAIEDVYPLGFRYPIRSRDDDCWM
jgi:hypothetical protein